MTPGEVVSVVRMHLRDGSCGDIRLIDADGLDVLTFAPCPVWGEGMWRADAAAGRVYGEGFQAVDTGSDGFSLVAYRAGAPSGILRIFIDEGTEAVL